MQTKVIKHCLNCGKEFTVSASNHTKLYCCARCGDAFRRKRHYSKHADEFRVRRAWLRTHRTERGIYQRIKSKCKRNNIPFNLTQDDIIIPEFCPVLGIKLNTNHGRSGYFDDSPSIDRIDPSLGYIKGNIRIISNRANLLKNNATINELELVINDLRRIRGW